MVDFCLGNDNILAVYLCPAAGRGMHLDLRKLTDCI